MLKSNRLKVTQSSTLVFFNKVMKTLNKDKTVDPSLLYINAEGIDKPPSLILFSLEWTIGHSQLSS